MLPIFFILFYFFKLLFNCGFILRRQKAETATSGHRVLKKPTVAEAGADACSSSSESEESSDDSDEESESNSSEEDEDIVGKGTKRTTVAANVRDAHSAAADADVEKQVGHCMIARG